MSINSSWCWPKLHSSQHTSSFIDGERKWMCFLFLSIFFKPSNFSKLPGNFSILFLKIESCIEICIYNVCGIYTYMHTPNQRLVNHFLNKIFWYICGGQREWPWKRKRRMTTKAIRGAWAWTKKIIWIIFSERPLPSSSKDKVRNRVSTNRLASFCYYNCYNKSTDDLHGIGFSAWSTL